MPSTRQSIFGFLAIAVLALSAAPSQSDEGWTVLFDGGSTDAFRGYKLPSFPTGHWKVEGNTLTAVPGGHFGAWDLLTKDEFTVLVGDQPGDAVNR